MRMNCALSGILQVRRPHIAHGGAKAAGELVEHAETGPL
jgi:hypothetical protein